MGTVSNPLKAPEKNIDNLPTLIDRSVFPGMQGGPHMNVVYAKAQTFLEALQPEFSEYAHQVVVNAKCLSEELIDKGFKLVTNGTDNHMMLVDMIKSFNISGGEAERIFDFIGLTMNKNVIPDDTRKPYDPSGVRLGTPAVTTRGMREKDMKVIADWMYTSIANRSNETYLQSLREEVKEYCSVFPLPSDL